MFRILFALAIAVLAVVTFMPDLADEAAHTAPARAVRDLGDGTVPAFRSRLESGASCAELIAIRDTYAPGSSEVARMNAELDGIGCHSISSERSR